MDYDCICRWQPHEGEPYALPNEVKALLEGM